MRLHLVLLALTLGCATEDPKTDDTSSNGVGDGSGEENGSGDDESEDMGNLLSQVADMATEIAEMSAKIAAQQATIVQLELEMSETLRWEMVEYTCAGSDDEHEAVGLSSVGAAAISVSAKDVGGDGPHWELANYRLADDGDVMVRCSERWPYWRVTVGYER